MLLNKQKIGDTQTLPPQTPIPPLPPNPNPPSQKKPSTQPQSPLLALQKKPKKKSNGLNRDLNYNPHKHPKSYLQKGEIITPGPVTFQEGYLKRSPGYYQNFRQGKYLFEPEATIIPLDH